MTANPIEVQTNIMHQSNAIRDALKGMQEWEKDIKKEEKERKADSKVKQLQIFITKQPQCQ